VVSKFKFPHTNPDYDDILILGMIGPTLILTKIIQKKITMENKASSFKLLQHTSSEKDLM